MGKSVISHIENSLADSAKIKKTITRQAPIIKRAADEMISALKRGGKIIVFGNGGSASDSQHMVAELIGRFRKEKKPLPAISLTANTSVLTAISNDYGYNYSFSKQIEALGKRNDIVFAISTSGNSKNVLEAVLAAKKMGIRSIGLSGKDGGRLAKISDISLLVPSENTARIQEAHIMIIHILCELVEEAFVRV